MDSEADERAGFLDGFLGGTLFDNGRGNAPFRMGGFIDPGVGSFQNDVAKGVPLSPDAVIGPSGGSLTAGGMATTSTPDCRRAFPVLTGGILCTETINAPFPKSFSMAARAEGMFFARYVRGIILAVGIFSRFPVFTPIIFSLGFMNHRQNLSRQAI